MPGQTFYFYGGIHNHYYFPGVGARPSLPTLKPKKGGTMIDKKDLMSENHDFSSIIPTITSKLRLVSFALDENIETCAIPGASQIIIEAAFDLDAINTALYGTPGELNKLIERYY